MINFRHVFHDLGYGPGWLASPMRQPAFGLRLNSHFLSFLYLAMDVGFKPVPTSVGHAFQAFLMLDLSPSLPPASVQ